MCEKLTLDSNEKSTMSAKDLACEKSREGGQEALNAESVDELQSIKAKYQSEPEKLKAIDVLQAALDIVGLEPTFGSLADGANAVIYLLRSAQSRLSGDADQSKKHLLDAGISAVSLIPFADVIKLLRLRKVPKLARLATKGARQAQKYAKEEKIKRTKKLTS